MSDGIQLLLNNARAAAAAAAAAAVVAASAREAAAIAREEAEAAAAAAAAAAAYAASAREAAAIARKEQAAAVAAAAESSSSEEYGEDDEGPVPPNLDFILSEHGSTVFRRIVSHLADVDLCSLFAVDFNYELALLSTVSKRSRRSEPVRWGGTGRKFKRRKRN
jgi:nucleoid-associated protein YgaU